MPYLLALLGGLFGLWVFLLYVFPDFDDMPDWITKIITGE